MNSPSGYPKITPISARLSTWTFAQWPVFKSGNEPATAGSVVANIETTSRTANNFRIHEPPFKLLWHSQPVSRRVPSQSELRHGYTILYLIPNSFIYLEIFKVKVRGRRVVQMSLVAIASTVTTSFAWLISLRAFWKASNVRSPTLPSLSVTMPRLMAS